MKEKLIIKNFGPIRSVELELRWFNVFIGEQGTGKSTVAKLLIAIQNTIHRDLFTIPEDLENRDTLLFVGHLEMVGIQTYYYQDTEVYYSTKKYSFELKNRNVILHKNLDFEQLYSYDFTYIPAERNLIISLSDSLFALIETGTSLPKLFLRFGDKFQKARKNEQRVTYKEILGIDYKHSEGKDIIILQNGKEIPISESSSGIQGSVTLLIVFDFVSMTSKVGNLMVIEEPELSCFPETQDRLVKHIIEKNSIPVDGKTNTYSNQIFFTTHSPYILTSINNLLYAHKVGEQYKEDTEKIIEKKYWLDQEDFSAYKLNPDGTCEDIFDYEEGLIKAEKIDGISSVLNNQFDALLNLEYAEK